MIPPKTVRSTVQAAIAAHFAEGVCVLPGRDLSSAHRSAAAAPGNPTAVVHDAHPEAASTAVAIRAWFTRV